MSMRLFHASCVWIIASLRFSLVPILKLHKMCERPGKDIVLPLKKNHFHASSLVNRAASFQIDDSHAAQQHSLPVNALI